MEVYMRFKGQELLDKTRCSIKDHNIGWVLPNGNFHKCQLGDHIPFANTVIEGLYGFEYYEKHAEHDEDWATEELGWIKIHESEWGLGTTILKGDDYKPTPKQIAVLKIYCRKWKATDTNIFQLKPLLKPKFNKRRTP